MSLIERIELQEEEDRFVSANLLTDIMKINGASDISFYPTPLVYPVDLSGKCNFYGTEVEIMVEIKKNSKTEEQISKYPNFLLKKDKVKRMMEVSEKKLLYFVSLVNERLAYIYNLNDLNFNTIHLKTIPLKKTQLDKYSDIELQEVYEIPMNRAGLIINCEKYYADYFQTKEEKQKDQD